MILCVTGGRNYSDTKVIHSTLDAVNADYIRRGDPITHLINGNARGADTVARDWAAKRGIQPVDCPALWDFYLKNGPKGAGPRRNRAMLQLNPHVLVAFPGGPGTANMLEQAMKLVAARKEFWDSVKHADSGMVGIHTIIKVSLDGTQSVISALRQ